MLWERRNEPLVAEAPPAYGNATSYEGDEQGWAVSCGEVANFRRDAAALVRQAAVESSRAGDSASFSTWVFDAPCLFWPGKAADSYRGPFDKNTSATILVIGNTYDPSTYYGNAVKAATQTLANARLLTVEGGLGHTAIINPSTCVKDYIAAYVVNGTLPPEGASCLQDCPNPLLANFTDCLAASAGGGGLVAPRRLTRRVRALVPGFTQRSRGLF